ncbi:glycosyltransferase family 4 protein [Brachybacterium paraconglomeratum]|uniref:glycosyltransferase n=1 Tax=Brachybacterium paraconglomeratum TaxID=173362 RepID=UPI0031F098F1
MPKGAGFAALGAFMAGESARAEELLEKSRDATAPLSNEVAVLLGRLDLVRHDAAASTRARAAWSCGDLSGAVRILETGGRGNSSHARRLRSELKLLEGGHRLSVPRTSQRHALPRADEPLRVLHLITNSLPHTQSGYSLRTHNILTGLRDHGIDSLALTRTGYPVMVGKPWCADEDVVDGIRYRRTLPATLGATPEVRLQQEVEEALRIVQEFRPHVLHATTDYRNGLVAQAVSEASGIPWMFEVRGLMEQTWIASHRGVEARTEAEQSEKVRRIIATESGLAREAGAVVTLSRTMAGALEERGVDGERISLMPNGVDATLLADSYCPAEARSALGANLPLEALAVGAVSALIDYEGHDILLRAVAVILADTAVPQALKDALHIVIVGDGVTAPALSDLAKELGIGDRVLMPGRAPRDEARLWVQALDVVVVPRKDFEVTRTVTPQKPAEAMALARPVVASDLPAIRETLTDDHGEELGVLVVPDSPRELAEALADLLGDERRRHALGAKGRAAARHRTWPEMMKRYEVAYRALVNSSAEETPRGE